MSVNRRDFFAFLSGLFISPARQGFAAPSTQAMLKPVAGSGFDAQVLMTNGDSIGEYRPPGIMDGTAAWAWGPDTVRVFVNHELRAMLGYPYELDSGVRLHGARISWFDIDRKSRAITGAGNAIRTVFDRRGREVISAEQINEQWQQGRDWGLTTLCSAQGYRAGTFGFVDDLMFTHEEVSAKGAHPHGGSVWVLDVRKQALWALPELGRGSWENVTAVATPDQDRPDGHIALLMGDDFEFGSAPIYLWISRKRPGSDLLARNGLKHGQLHVWVADQGHKSPSDWNGTGATASGRFVPVTTRNPSAAGKFGHDRDGFLNDELLREQARGKKAFMFSRPEDLHTNPSNPSQVALCSCGQGNVYPEDDWGTVYLIDIRIEVADIPSATGRITILHDTDDFGEAGIRSPDNVAWASDGMIYVQEDNATKINEFSKLTGRETSVWRIDPDHPEDRSVIATIDRSVILPTDARDIKADEPNTWESSGILDVSAQFGVDDELLLLTTVQAHTLRGGALGGGRDLFQGGQLLLLSRKI